jgi:hypothetical protein
VYMIIRNALGDELAYDVMNMKACIYLSLVTFR